MNKQTFGHSKNTAAQQVGADTLFSLSFSVEPLIGIVSRHVKLSAKVRHAIERDFTDALGRGGVQVIAASIAPHDERPATATATADANLVLTTEQAAQLIGVSRPFMVKLIDSGAIALHRKVGNQRRILQGDLLRWQHDERARQRKALKRLASDLDEEILSS
jgi:excisionase family DNA binding protein